MSQTKQPAKPEPEPVRAVEEVTVAEPEAVAPEPAPSGPGPTITGGRGGGPAPRVPERNPGRCEKYTEHHWESLIASDGTMERMGGRQVQACRLCGTVRLLGD